MKPTVNYTRCPEHLQGGMKRYIEDRIAPGGFLLAVVENNLRRTFERADLENRCHVFDLLQFLYNDAPSSCWGSEEKVAAWLAGDCEHGISKIERCFDCDPNTGVERRR